jgi:hypothetical protein
MTAPATSTAQKGSFKTVRINNGDSAAHLCRRELLYHISYYRVITYARSDVSPISIYERHVKRVVYLISDWGPMPLI